MKKIDTLDLIASDNPDMLLIAAVSALIKSLRLSAVDHREQSRAAQSRANTAQEHGDDEAYHYWLNMSLEEDSKYRNIFETLQRFNIIFKSYEKVQESENVEK